MTRMITTINSRIALTASVARREQELQHGRYAVRPGNLVVVAAFDFGVAKAFAEFPSFLDQGCLQSAGIEQRSRAFHGTDVEPDPQFRLSLDLHLSDRFQDGPITPPDRRRHHGELAEHPAIA